jgi:DsbE subfamily thiol:disulfide oxidoreductase
VNRRGWILLGVGLPILAFLSILAWASLQTRGTPGGMGINTDFGVVEIKPKPAQDFSLELMARMDSEGDGEGNGDSSGEDGISGGSVSLSEMRGKVVLVDFWASWCPPCRQEAAALEEVYREYAGPEVEFIGVNIWDLEDNAHTYVKDFGLTYPSGVDTDGVIAIDYGVRGIPEKFFIGRDGVIRQKFVGPMSADTLRQTLDRLLAEKGTGR